MIYKLPLKERFCHITSRSCIYKQKLVEVDGIGMYVYYDKPWQLRKSWIRRHMIGLKDNRCYIRANSLKEAIAYFHAEYDGAKCGTIAKALVICTDFFEIKEYPDCDKILNFDTGRPKCGVYEVEEGEEPTASCVLDGCDCPPRCCPIARAKQAYEQSTVVKEEGLDMRRYNAMAIEVEQAW